ncbi:hypothetical protein AA0Y32_09265 [Georgenia phoenicis]|uniref:hypothetical protein n=1 Tax=unclassified Georgenia TaxID=2626815 RepID=UPI0039AF11DE
MPLTQAVDERRDEALARLATATGDASLCAVSRDGTARPAVKYHEGAVAALGDLRRRLSQEPADAALVHARAHWRALEDRAAAAPSWEAYLAGAVDALDDVAHAAPGSEPPDDVAALVAVHGPLPVDLARAHPHRHWTLRHTVAAVVLTPLLLALLVTEGGGWDAARAPLWTALVSLAAVGGAAVLATYVPARGHRSLGLLPCTVVPLMTVLAAGWLLGAETHAVPGALGAVVAVGFGLANRLTGTRCGV